MQKTRTSNDKNSQSTAKLDSNRDWKYNPTKGEEISSRNSKSMHRSQQYNNGVKSATKAIQNTLESDKSLSQPHGFGNIFRLLYPGMLGITFSNLSHNLKA